MPKPQTVDPSTHGKWLGHQKTPGDSREVGDKQGVMVVHAVLLHTGRILMWSSRYETTGLLYASWTWDPITGDASPPLPFDGNKADAEWTVDNNIDLFCSHHVVLEDGRVLAMGGGGAQSEGDSAGHDGVFLFDPAAGAHGKWQKSADMTHGRWYPTPVMLGDGSVVVFSGWKAISNHPYREIVAQPEILSPPNYQPRVVKGADQALPLFPGLHMVPGGSVYYTGTTWRYSDDHVKFVETSSYRQINGVSGTWTRYRDNTRQPLFPRQRNREEATSVLLSPAQDGRILLIGGANAGGGDEPHASSDPTSWEILETHSGTPTWSFQGSMKTDRINVNAVLLPDGKVLILGGHSRHKFNHAKSERAMTAELFDPEVAMSTSQTSEPIVETGPMSRSRMYHSTALLLPDGSVWCGGGEDRFAPETTPGEYKPRLQKNMEIYQPPYFFQGTRPVLESTSETNIDYGATFSVDTPNASEIEKVVLMKPGSVTHHTDPSQRCVPLRFEVGSTKISASMETDPTVAPPGHYMIFIVDREGRPCERAAFVRVKR